MVASDSPPQVIPKRQPTRQYYYFYGSTADAGDRVLQPPPSPAVTNETDSLVGESLVLTDNEEDLPKNSARDQQQLLVDDHGNGRLRPLERIPEQHEKNCFMHFCWLLRNFQRRNPCTLLIGISVFLCTVTILGFAEKGYVARFKQPSSATSPTVSLPRNRKFRMLFPEIDRSTYNDPVSNFIDVSLFHSSLSAQSKGLRTFNFPFPTGAFWTNFVLPPTADRGLSYPVAVYPYAYKWSDELLEVSYPALHRKEEPKMIHDYFFPDLTFGVVESASARKVMRFDPLSVTLRYFLGGTDSFWETYLVQGSPYITIKYQKSSPVIKAFTTFTNVLCPRTDTTQFDDGGSMRRKLKFGVCYSDTDQSSSRMTSLHGVQFVLETQEGVRWIVFSSELISLNFDTQLRTTITATADSGKPYNGILRMAIVPTPESQTGKNDGITTQTTTSIDQILKSSGMQRLIYHAGVYPVSGAVSWSFRSNGTEPSGIPASAMMHALQKSTDNEFLHSTLSGSASTSSSLSSNGRIGTVQFKFETESFTPASTTPKSLLMMALPHHVQRLPQSIQLGRDAFDLVFRCIKGPMRPVLGSSWSYDEPLPSLGFEGDSGSNSEKAFLRPPVRSEIVKSMEEEIKLALPTLTENVYGFGKQAARLAQMAHIAHELLGTTGNISHSQSESSNMTKTENQDGSVLASLFDEAKFNLEAALDNFLNSRVSDSLVYDGNLGGLVTTDGLLNSEADFGNGRYNDHHFHYGYILYACAIMGKIDPSFVDKYGSKVDAIYLDVAHGSNFDSKASVDGIFFPGARHKVWFDGHSYASGMFSFGNGKSMESSSESVNCYYGALLWSIVRNGKAQDPSADDSPETDFARLLLAMEIRGAKTYWQMMPPANSTNRTDSLSVYSPEFSQNYMVGNVGMLDALCSTWFGTESLYVHMINFLPVTSVTGDLFSSNYVNQEYSKVLKPLGEVEVAWRGYVVADQAIVDPIAAWNKAVQLDGRTLDAGVSKTQILYWISTRKGFNASAIPNAHTSDKDVTGTSVTAACSSFSSCAALTGDCCPTSDGRFLDCCSASR